MRRGGGWTAGGNFGGARTEKIASARVEADESGEYSSDDESESEPDQGG